VSERAQRVDPEEVTWAELRPVRLKAHEERELAGERRVDVLIPRFRNVRLARLARRLGLHDYRVHLDDVGSYVWDLLDGRRTVGELAAAVERRFGPRVDPVDERLPRFLQQMRRARMIELVEQGADASASTG
jgi:hypothetical protein